MVQIATDSKLKINHTYMETLYIDTSIFESNNFFEGHRIKQLYRLSKNGKIKIVLPELTYDEIRNRLHINIKSSIERFDKYRKDTRVLRNIPSIQDRFNDVDLNIILEESDNMLKSTFNDSKIVIIDYQELNIKCVFNKYFQEEFPFSSGKKKNEFPDAFALYSIEKWASENSTKVNLFSNDQDLLKYHSENLIIHENFDEYINNKIREEQEYEAIISKVDKFIKEEQHDILSFVSEWVKDQLNDTSIYLDITNWLEVYDVDVTNVESEIAEYEIMEFNDEYIAVQFKMLIRYVVDLSIDDEDYMIKDYDTKEWIFLDTTVKTHEASKYIDMNVVFYPDEDETMDVEFEEINHGQDIII